MTTAPAAARWDDRMTWHARRRALNDLRRQHAALTAELRDLTAAVEAARKVSDVAMTLLAADVWLRTRGADPRAAQHRDQLAAALAGATPVRGRARSREEVAAEIEHLLGTDTGDGIARRLGYASARSLSCVMRRAGRGDLAAALERAA